MNSLNNLMYTMAAGVFTFMATTGFTRVVESVRDQG